MATQIDVRAFEDLARLGEEGGTPEWFLEANDSKGGDLLRDLADSIRASTSGHLEVVGNQRYRLRLKRTTA